MRTIGAELGADSVRAGALAGIIAIALILGAATGIICAISGMPNPAGLGALAALPVLLVVWLVSGPLADGWARRSGTPEPVLAAASASAGSASTGSVASGAAGTTVPGTTVPATTPQWICT